MDNNLRILVVDDEVLIAEYLKDVLLTLDFKSITLAHSQEQALNEIDRFKPDLVVLDIRMQAELEGIAIADEINRSFKIPFIFITAHSDKEIIQKALQTNPAGYITKPFKKMDVFAAINMAIKSANVLEKSITFKDGYSSIKLNVNDIFYVESEGNYIQIYSIQKKYTIRYSLEWFLENVSESQFKKVHRSYVINLAKVEKTTSKSVFINSIEIPVARNKKVDLGNF